MIKRWDADKAGRNIVRDGFREKSGETREARKAEVVESTELMRGWIAPAPETTATGPPPRAPRRPRARRPP